MIIINKKLAVFEKAWKYTKHDYNNGKLKNNGYKLEIKSFQKELNRLKQDYILTPNATFKIFELDKDLKNELSKLTGEQKEEKIES